MVHNLTEWRSARKAAQHREWSAFHLEELFSVLKSVEEGRGSVVMGQSGVTISAGYGMQVTLDEEGTVFLGDGSCALTETLYFSRERHNCFSLLESSTLIRFLGLLLASLAEGMGFVEWSAGHGVIYSDLYGCWVVFSRDGAVEFNRLQSR
jgi:hypothetical protein